MSIYTQIFLSNAIALFFMATMDRKIFNDAIKKSAGFGTAFGLWALVSWFSLPVWLIYLVFSA